MDIVSYILGKNSSGGGTIVSKTITENGTYNALDDSADGYSPVTVNVPDWYSYMNSYVPYYDVETNETNMLKEGENIFSRIAKRLPPLNMQGSNQYMNLFNGLTELEEPPIIINTTPVVAMDDMFRHCCSLISGPQFDTTPNKSFLRMFYGCYNLVTVPQYNASNIVWVDGMFAGFDRYGYDVEMALTTFGGLLNLGQAYDVTKTAGFWQYNLTLLSCTALTHDSLMNVINGLYDIAGKGCNAQSLWLGSTNLAKLTATEIAIATTKGWTVT